MDDLFSVFTAVTGLSKDELIGGAVNPEKQPELLRKVSENARPRDTFKEAIDEMNRK